jgi:hypothetical protein
VQRVPKMLVGAYKTQRMVMVSADFSEQYHKDGDELLNHTVTGDEPWV